MKNKLSLVLFTTLSACMVPSLAHAEDNDPPKHKWVGLSMDLGVPDGGAVGLVISPYFYWLKTTINYTNNYFASGGRMGITLDPIKFPVGLTLTAEYGFTTTFNPSKTIGTDLPDMSLRYLNLQPGLEFGSPNGFRFFLRGGLTNLWASGHNLNRFINQPNLSVSDGSVQAWVAPTVKLGFTALFF